MSSYTDFLKGLPPEEMWGERIYITDDFHYSESLNATVELLDKNLEWGFGNRPAVFYKDQKFTYNELAAMTGKMGNALRSLGVGKGDRIMLRFPNTPTAVALWLAILRVGGVADEAAQGEPAEGVVLDVTGPALGWRGRRQGCRGRQSTPPWRRLPRGAWAPWPGRNRSGRPGRR